MRNIPVICFLILLIAAPVNGRGQTTIYASDYGLQEGRDATLPILRALEACRQKGADRLLIPEGHYDCYPDNAFEKYCRITNNDNGMKRILFPLIGLEDLEIDGSGSVFMLHGLMMSAVFEESARIRFRNMSFDWAVPYYAQGEVISVNEEEKWYDLRLDDYLDYRVIGNDLVFTRGGRDYYLKSNFWFEPETKSPVYNLHKYMGRSWDPYKDKHYTLQDLGDYRIRVVNRVDSLPEPGWLFIAKWRNLPKNNRIAPSIHLFHASDIFFENISIHSAAGMGIVGERSGNISMHRVEVIPSPGGKRVISITADATHFVNCRGLISYDSCRFEHQLDDGLNIHGAYAEVSGLIDDNTLGVRMMHRQQFGFEFAVAGDSLRLIEKNTLMPTGVSFKVLHVEQINEEYFEITADRTLTNMVKPGMGLDNTTWTADLVMRNCSIGNNWGRSILAKTAGKLLIENNQFYSSAMGIRNWGDMHFFYESGALEDLTIRNNTFRDMTRVGAGYPLILFHPQVYDPEAARGRYYNRNILIEGNTIYTFERPLLYAGYTKDLVFRNNRIIRTNTHKPLQGHKPVIDLESCRDISIYENTYEGTPAADIRADELSLKTLKTEKNKGFEK